MSGLKSVVLLPYCPLPVDTGAKAEMWRYLQLLRELGPCRVVSARSRPVGAGWLPETVEKFRQGGFELRLREDYRGRTPVQWFGIAYAAFCKGLRLERAFGHSNPYHRHAFPPDWWHECQDGMDVAVIHYSYWAWLPCSCRKVVNLLDLWSDYMWEGPWRETADLKTADLVMTISMDEEDSLRRRGIGNMVWVPPAVAPRDFARPSAVGMIGSASDFNLEGLHWLEGAGGETAVRVYGGLAGTVRSPRFVAVGRYEDAYRPYGECGVILMTTTQGMGVQIKAIEALACGRAIVARRGAMRGIPPGEGAWIEVDTPQQMMEESEILSRDAGAREEQGARARAYYDRHLDHAVIDERIRNALSGR